MNVQAEHLQLKYVGTGNPDTTKEEWFRNQRMDVLSSIISHPNLLLYTSVAENKCSKRMKHDLKTRMIECQREARTKGFQ